MIRHEAGDDGRGERPFDMMVQAPSDEFDYPGAAKMQFVYYLHQRRGP